MKILLKFCSILLLIFLTTNVYADGYKLLKKENNVLISYKIQLNKKTNQQEIKVKIVNRAKTTLSIETQIGIYDNGILNGKNDITDCLKRGFLNNLFPPIYLISTSDVENKTDLSVELQVTSFKATPTDGCRETDR